MRKKILFYVKLLLLLIFFCTLIPISSASARAGGSTSSSYSSSSSNSGFFRRNYYRRYRGGYTNPVLIFFAATIVTLITSWPKVQKHLHSANTNLNLSSKNKEAVKKIKSLSAVDDIWNLSNLEFRVNQAFWAIQDGWTKRDINLCEDYLDSNKLREYEYQIKNMIYAHEVNILKNINLLQCVPMEVSFDNYNKKYYVSFFIKAKLRDYIASDINGTLIRGNTNMMTFSEIWIFTLSQDRKWKLCEIQKL